MDKAAHLKLCETYKGVAESLTKAAYGRPMDLSAASRLAAKIASLADREIKLAGEGGVTLACKPGCNHCCQLMPTGSAPEVAWILENLQTWEEGDRQALIERMREYVGAAEPHRPEGFTRFRKACPFLVDGLCSIYAYRPLFCRGITSENAELCEEFNKSPSAEEVFGPNGELGLAQAMIGGAMEGSGAGKVRFEIPRAVYEIPTQPARLNDLFLSPASFKRQAERPWNRAFPAPAHDPLTKPIQDQGYWRFIDRRREEPMTDLLPLISRQTAANALAKITMPSIFSTKEEMEGWWEGFESAIDAALDQSAWDHSEAYLALSDLRPIGAAYQPHSMTEAMRKIGRLLTDRIATPLAPDLLEPLGPRKPGRLRVGILSDIADKSGANWALGWVRGLDRQAFEVTVLKTFGNEDAVSFQFKELADSYYRLAGHPIEAARFVRSLDLDYLIYTDLGDYGAHYWYAIFRLARRQAAAWGCPFTSGLHTVDDYLSSDLMERPGADADYVENLVRLPNTALTLEAPRWPRLEGSRSRYGLPEGFLVGFPQYVIKWLPEHDELMAEISGRVKNPIVLFDAGGVHYETEVFKRRLEQRGIKALWLPRTRNTATFRAIVSQLDVALDSPGWSGGLTAMHCLSLGVPFVSLPGEFLRQRLAMGFSYRAEAPGLIAKDASDYVELATSPERLREAIQGARPEALFGDLEPLRALERHIQATAAADFGGG